MENNIKTADPLAKALSILQENISIGEMKPISQLITKKGGEVFFIEAVKRLIDAGWIEYEFTNDYTGIKMIDTSCFSK